MPDLQKHIEDLTKALGAYIKESHSRGAQPPAKHSLSSLESDSETAAPAAAASLVHQVVAGSKRKQFKLSFRFAEK